MTNTLFGQGTQLVEVSAHIRRGQRLPYLCSRCSAPVPVEKCSTEPIGLVVLFGLKATYPNSQEWYQTTAIISSNIR